MLRHLQEVAHDDVDSVRRLKAKHLGPEFAMADKPQGGDDVGNIIITDDYHHNDAPPPPPPAPAQAARSVGAWLGAAGGLVAGAAGAGALAVSLLGRPAPVTPAPTPSRAFDLIYEVQQPDGSWKQTKRERLTPKE